MTNIFYKIITYFIKIYNYIFSINNIYNYYSIQSNKKGICFPILSNNHIYFVTNYHILNNVDGFYNNRKIILSYNNIKYNLQIEKKYNKHDLILLKLNTKDNLNIQVNNIETKMDILDTFYIMYNNIIYNVHFIKIKLIKLNKSDIKLLCITFDTKLSMVSGLSGLPIYSKENNIVGIFSGKYKHNNLMIPYFVINNFINHMSYNNFNFKIHKCNNSLNFSIYDNFNDSITNGEIIKKINGMNITKNLNLTNLSNYFNITNIDLPYTAIIYNGMNEITLEYKNGCKKNIILSKDDSRQIKIKNLIFKYDNNRIKITNKNIKSYLKSVNGHNVFNLDNLINIIKCHYCKNIKFVFNNGYSIEIMLSNHDIIFL